MCKVLHTRTSKHIYSIIMKTIILTTTEPAPLIVTSTTSHMITSRNFFYSDFTFRTILNILAFSPIFEVLVHCIFTFDISMPLCATLKTYFKSTFTFNSSFLAFLYKMITVWSRTPFQVWVYIDIYILFKL
jgi:hypothetical protein